MASKVFLESGWREHKQNADCWDVTGYAIWEFVHERDASEFALRWA